MTKSSFQPITAIDYSPIGYNRIYFGGGYTTVSKDFQLTVGQLVRAYRGQLQVKE